jgi:hypothetical protein
MSCLRRKPQKETVVSPIAPRPNPSTWIIAALAVAGIGASSAFVLGSRPTPEPAPERSLDALTKDRVIAFAGGPPERCVYARPDREICTWKLDGTLLAPGSTPATEGVNLVCELPIRPGGEFAGTCTPHARNATAELPPVSAGDASKVDLERRGRGRPLHELDDAATLLDLSQRLGDAPEICRTGVQQQTCVWRVPEPIAARSFASAGPLELRCTLPLDGSARAPGSCRAAPLR